MDNIDDLISICKLFIEKKYDIQEFQSRLETFVILDDQKYKLAKLINESVNNLEEIVYTSKEDHYYKYGAEIANKLICDVNLLIFTD
jgi:hypothetical protein